MTEFTESRISLLERLNTDPEKGLSAAQASENAVKYGVNTFTKEKPESLLRRIRRSSAEPMILMLVMAGLIAFAVNIIRFTTGGETEFLECAGIFAAISLSIIITVVMEGKSAKAFEALNKINEDIVVKAVRDGSPVTLHQKDIAAGDILLLSTGDRVPADGRLMESMGLSADESALTGESSAAGKNAEAVFTDEKTPLAERSNMLYSGTYITGGFCKLAVTSVGDKTEFGKIARELSSVSGGTTPLQEKLARLGKIITVFGVIAAAVVFAAQLVFLAAHSGLVPDVVMEAFITSIVLIVAAVPEGLPTIVAVSLSINIIKLAGQNALVKKMIACETVGCVNVICSDKTGTLTENRMTVAGTITDEVLLRNICVNSTADIGEEGGFIGSPTECALLVAAGKSGWGYKEIRRNAEIAHVFPFSSEEKDMTTIIKEPQGYTAYTKGSPEKIFRSCNMTEEEYSSIEGQITAYEKKSCRIIAFAHRVFDEYPAIDEKAIESGMAFDGFAAISDPLRADVFEAVENCRLAGINIKMLTGDNIITAAAIAGELRLLDEKHIAVEARELEALSDEELSEKLAFISVIARSTPVIKMRVVKLLKEKGNVVAVTGDGINDAPAVKNADVGIAMGITGTEVTKEAADIVLLNDSFSTIVRAIEWGRGIYENFRRFISFQLTANVSSVTVVLASVLLGLKAPFTALQLLWINIIMDGPPALALGLEPVHDDLLRRPPVKRGENIISKQMLAKIGFTGLYISAVFLIQNKFNLIGANNEEMPGVLFSLFAIFQLFNAFNCRVLDNSSIFKTFTENPLMLAVFLLTLIIQVLIVQFAGAFFGVESLPPGLWAKIFAAAASVIIVSELVKLVRRVVNR
jgi:Ca2+-transporting ATPase